MPLPQVPWAAKRGPSGRVEDPPPDQRTCSHVLSLPRVGVVAVENPVVHHSLPIPAPVHPRHDSMPQSLTPPPAMLPRPRVAPITQTLSARLRREPYSLRVTLPAGELGHRQRNGPAENVGRHHRFYLPPTDDVTGVLDPRALDPAVPYMRYDHYDVTVHWNNANPALNVSTYASERGYHRLYFGHRAFEEVTGRLAEDDSVKSYLGGGQVDVNVLAKFVRFLEPRTAADFRPMFILFQGILRDMLDDKIRFLSKEADRLRVQFAADMKAQKEAYEKALADMRMSHDAALNKVTQDLLAKTQLVMDYQLTMEKDRRAREEADQARSARDKLEAEKIAKEHENEILQLRAVTKRALTEASELKEEKYRAERIAERNKQLGISASADLDEEIAMRLKAQMDEAKAANNQQEVDRLHQEMLSMQAAATRANQASLAAQFKAQTYMSLYKNTLQGSGDVTQEMDSLLDQEGAGLGMAQVSDHPTNQSATNRTTLGSDKGLLVVADPANASLGSADLQSQNDYPILNKDILLGPSNGGLDRSTTSTVSAGMDPVARVDKMANPLLFNQPRDGDVHSYPMDIRNLDAALGRSVGGESGLGLGLLFGTEGMASLCRSEHDFKLLAQLACSYMERNYNVKLEITHITYDPNYDNDGDEEDNPDTYSDNVHQVILSSLGHAPHAYIDRPDAALHLEAADARMHKLSEDGERALLPIVLEDNSVWGSVEVRGHAGMLRKAFQVANHAEACGRTSAVLELNRSPIELLATGLARVRERVAQEHANMVQEIATHTMIQTSCNSEAYLIAGSVQNSPTKVASQKVPLQSKSGKSVNSSPSSKSVRGSQSGKSFHSVQSKSSKHIPQASKSRRDSDGRNGTESIPPSVHSAGGNKSRTSSLSVKAADAPAADVIMTKMTAWAMGKESSRGAARPDLKNVDPSSLMQLQEQWSEIMGGFVNQEGLLEFGMGSMQAKIDTLLQVKSRVEGLFASDTMKKALMEMKRYRKPPWTVACCTAGIFLNLNIPGVIDWMKWDDNDQVYVVPRDEHALGVLWKQLSKKIESDLVHSMQAYDPMEIPEPEFDAEGRDCVKLKADSLNWILENVSASAAAKSSQTALLIRQWLDVCQRMRELSMSIDDLHELKVILEHARSHPDMTPSIQETSEDGLSIGAMELPT